MTTMLNGKAPSDTVRDDVQMRVRAPETPQQRQNPEDRPENPRITRAIPRRALSWLGFGGRNSASTHVAEVKRAAVTSWPLTEAPPAPLAMWQQVFPEPGEASGKFAWVAMTLGGLARACIIQLLWLLGVGVATRTRAGVATLLLLILAAIYTAAHLT